MRLEARKYLFDIQEAAKLVSQFTSGKTFLDYQNDAMMRLAIERAFAIVGEALVQLVRVDPLVADQIRDFRSIIAFRNILVHAYAQVDDRIVWEIVETKLASLVSDVTLLMSQP